MDVIEFLRRVPLFKGLSPKDLGHLADVVRSQSFPPEANIVEIGEPGNSLFVLLEGTVQVLYPARNADFELARLTEGDFFGEMALLNSMPRSATVKSVDPVRVLVLEKEAFQKVLAESPSVATGLLETLSIRIRNADEQISGLSDKAMRDALTGLLNRRAFHERLTEETDRARRYGDQFALILVDIDQFKAVNDTFGHDIGDEILSWIGRVLTEHTRAADMPFRIGGEEFAVLAPATNSEVASFVAQRLVSLVAEARPPVNLEMHVTMSAGYACCPVNADRPTDLYSMADQALLKAKSAGRNQVSHPTTE
ncbi:GGDEF domain-containing protein [Gemmatimonadota bacterium]